MNRKLIGGEHFGVREILGFVALNIVWGTLIRDILTVIWGTAA